MSEFNPPVLRLGKKTEKCGIGQKKDPSRQPKPIKAESPKQRKRTDELKERFKVVLAVQEEMYGGTFCMAGAGLWKDRCPNNKGKKYPLQPDHVMTRNQVDADRYGNLQPLCGWCNYFLKGSQRIDFRPPEFKARLEQLDEAEKMKEVEE